MSKSLFRYKDLEGAFKSLADTDPTEGLTHCQDLDHKARALGFQNYHHLRTSLLKVPRDNFGSLSLAIMRKICAMRLPVADQPYYEFHWVPGDAIGFYSEWAGWDKNGDEVRVPRELDGRVSVIGLRKLLDCPVYVVENITELFTWQHIWKSYAYIRKDLAEKIFVSTFSRKRRVVKNPPLELIKAKYASKQEKYDGNWAPTARDVFWNDSEPPI